MPGGWEKRGKAGPEGEKRDPPRPNRPPSREAADVSKEVTNKKIRKSDDLCLRCPREREEPEPLDPQVSSILYC